MARSSGSDSGSQVSPKLNQAGVQSRENQFVSMTIHGSAVRGQGIRALSRISSAWRSSMRYWVAKWNANSSMRVVQSIMQKGYRSKEPKPPAAQCASGPAKDQDGKAALREAEFFRPISLSADSRTPGPS